MKKTLAQIISFIFYPVLMLTPVPFILVLRSTKNLTQAFFWEEFSLFFILIFGIFILIGIKKKFFSDLNISQRTQRPLAYSFAIALGALYITSLYLLKAPFILFIGLFELIFGLITMEIINRFTKASVHLGVVAAFSTSLAIVYGGIFYLTFFFIPLVAWARIVTKNHTIKQTAIGALVGILTTLTVYVIFKYIV